MDAAFIEPVLAELREALIGKKFGKIFQLSRFSIAVDFRLPDSRYLFISVEPAASRVYLIRRRVRDLEKQSSNTSPFALFLRKRLSGGVVAEIDRIADERAIRIDLSMTDEFENAKTYSLIIQLTGRSANLFLTDERLFIIDSWRETTGEGQTIGDNYAPPRRPSERRERTGDSEPAVPETSGSISERLDQYYLEKAEEQRFQSLANAARNKLKQEIAKREKLAGKLRGDLAAHGDAEHWKRLGDLLLANVSTAKRDGNKILVTDYYDENQSQVAIDVDENLSITEAAEKFFKKYTKARNAASEIQKRLAFVARELDVLRVQQNDLDEAIAECDETLIESVSGKAAVSSKTRQRKPDATDSAVRTFLSSDGFEILVGKKAKDNDFLTFRIAKSLDTWMHAADYPGSHVVIRNPNRKEIPYGTLLEAAQLAAFYSQGKTQPKAAVHYTQKKFVNKPRGAAPGLVSLASFKTLLVEPKIPFS